MRKISLSIVLVFLSLGLWAQNDVKLRFGVQAGFNMSKWAGDYSDVFGTSFKPGGNLGGLAEIQINTLWSVQPEFVISMEGTKTDGGTLVFCQGQPNEYPIELTDKVDAWYFKVPIYVLYNFKVGPGRLSPGLGLYIAWAFAGSSSSESTFADDSYFRTTNEQIREDYLKYPQYYSDEDKHNMDLWDKCIPRRFDYGVGVKAIYELEHPKFSGVFASLGVTEGLTGCYNLNLMFSLGYKFKYNKWLRTAYNTGILEYNP